MHGVRGALDWYVLRLLWLGSLPMAVLTLILLNNSPVAGGPQLILPLLGVALVLTGGAMLSRPASTDSARDCARISRIASRRTGPR